MQIQQGGPLGTFIQLLLDPAVQKDIGLTEAKMREIKQGMNKIKDKFTLKTQGLQTLSPTEKQETFANISSEMITEFENTLSAVLSPQQQIRFRQIHLQGLGIRVLLDETVQETLAMTDQQRAQIQTAVRESFMSVRSAEPGSTDIDLPDTVLGLLTEDQRTALNEVLGKNVAAKAPPAGAPAAAPQQNSGKPGFLGSTAPAPKAAPRQTAAPAQRSPRPIEKNQDNDPFRFDYDI